VDKPGTSACHEVVMVTSYFPYSSEQSWRPQPSTQGFPQAKAFPFGQP
jgi:hypothetical protein